MSWDDDMGKRYVNKTVYDAAVERINKIFDEFEKVAVSFSSGKDSGALLNMTIDIARQRGRRVGVLFIDLEAFYQLSIQYVEKMFSENADVLDPYWVCLPMESPNSVSYLEPTWVWWEQEKQPIWVRPMPTNQWVINTENNPFGFYYDKMPFEEFIKYWGDWYADGKTATQLVGIRTDESLNRFRAVAGNNNQYMYKDWFWSTKVGENTYSMYPIYDWSVEDIWTYYGKFNKPYNHTYDLMYRAGVSIHKMRIDEPFGNEAKAGLNLFRVIEPETWGRVVNRVSGANFGNIYSGKKIMTADYTLPKGHTWKSFCKFLLDTLPPKTAAIYREKFIKFIKYWNKKGSPVQADFLEELEEQAGDAIINTHTFSKRGTGDKEVVRFKRIVDELPGLDTKQDMLTWKRMAMCIIKNDIVCKSLSFQMTKDMVRRKNELMEKYKNI